MAMLVITRWYYYKIPMEIPFVYLFYPFVKHLHLPLPASNSCRFPGEVLQDIEREIRQRYPVLMSLQPQRRWVGLSGTMANFTGWWFQTFFIFHDIRLYVG